MGFGFGPGSDKVVRIGRVDHFIKAARGRSVSGFACMEELDQVIQFI